MIGRCSSARSLLDLWAPGTMPMMRTTHPDRRSTPSVVRVCIDVLLILGVLAMHNAVLGGDESVGHHDAVMVASVAPDPGAPNIQSLTTNSDSGVMPGPLSDCGGLMVLCVAMILGVGAYVLLRRRLVDRVLWQLPPATMRLPVFAVVPPFDPRSALQRSSVLRC